MGGGPASADVVRSSCILTFPEETDVEPVPVDAWYLHAVGLTFLRRLARDRVGESMKISLLMQRVDPDSQAKRYIAVNSDEILKNALKETFETPDRVLVLHIISLEQVAGQRSIHVRPEINANVSPEPVAPLGMVFPTLAVEASQEIPESMALASSYHLGQSVYDFGKVGRDSFMGESKRLSHSTSFFGKNEDLSREHSSRVKNYAQHAPVQKPHQYRHGDADGIAFSFSATGAKLLSSAEDDDTTGIPLARVIGHAEESEAPRIPSDYVMLELQNGAGLSDDAATMPSNSASTFFISTTWHLQADDAAASMEFSADEPIAVPRASTESGSSSWEATDRERSSDSSMEESFVMLERDVAPK